MNGTVAPPSSNSTADTTCPSRTPSSSAIFRLSGGPDAWTGVDPTSLPSTPGRPADRRAERALHLVGQPAELPRPGPDQADHRLRVAVQRYLVAGTVHDAGGGSA